MFEIVLVAVIVDPTAPVYSLQARRPPTRRPRGFPPVQQLQCRDSGFVQSFAGNFMAFGEEALFFEVPLSLLLVDEQKTACEATQDATL